MFTTLCRHSMEKVYHQKYDSITSFKPFYEDNPLFYQVLFPSNVVAISRSMANELCQEVREAEQI